MHGSNFKNEMLFVSFTAIITTRNGCDGTNFYIGNRKVSSIKMSVAQFNFMYITVFLVVA